MVGILINLFKDKEDKMQTELMLRLLKDGKIFGYAWMLPYEKAKKNFTSLNVFCPSSLSLLDEYLYPEREYENAIITLYSDNINGRWYPIGTINMEKPDSFELGVKNYDVWRFEGDMFLVSIYGFPEKMELVYEEFEWGFRKRKGDVVYPVKIWSSMTQEYIGNVHDDPELSKEK